MSVLRPDSALGKLARAPLSLIPRDAVVPVLSGPLRGAKWIRGASQNGCWLGWYERPTQAILSRLIRPGATVLDVGANVGFFTLFAARLVGPSGRVIAFEPFHENAARLRRHVQMNRPAVMSIEEVALGQESGSAVLHVGTTESGSLYPHDRGLHPFFVTVVALDDWRASGRLPRVDVIKMDIEGAEGAAVLGMRRVISEDRPTLFIALHRGPFEAEMLALFHELNYRVASPNGEDMSTAAELIALPNESAQAAPAPFRTMHPAPC